MRIKRVVGVWAVLAGLMVVNGVVRIALLVPFFGNAAGEMMSVFLGIIIIFGAARPFLLEEPRLSARQILPVSATWLALTVAFEAGLGWASGRPWSAVVRAYAFWDGSMWPILLVAVIASPFVWLRPQELPVWRVTK